MEKSNNNIDNNNNNKEDVMNPSIKKQIITIKKKHYNLNK